jgi:signal transduction histidine kinase
MKSAERKQLNLGRRLTLTIALLIAVILAGNGLVLLQFQEARQQADRLRGVSQQLIAVLRLQKSLLSFHQRLDDLVQSKDAQLLATEAEPLRNALLEETQRVKTTLAYLGPEFHADASLVTAMEAIEITLPLQLQDLINLAKAGDWEVMHLHLDQELGRIEGTTSAGVQSINRELDEELPLAVANTRDVQRRIRLIVPATAIATVFIAVLCGWAIARRMLELRVEERVNERSRIARDLHDTLLQNFQAALMNFGALRYLIPDRPDVQEKLQGVLEQARAAIREARDAVQGLRATTVDAEDFNEGLRALGQELASDPAHSSAAAVTINIEGTPRTLHPLVRDEIYRIAGEALRNAYRHAGASRIEVQLEYGERRIELRVRDNGKGIDPAALGHEALPGHFGLPGMRERAKEIGAKFMIWSAPGSGTELELSVPGSMAYGSAPRGRYSWRNGRASETRAKEES